MATIVRGRSACDWKQGEVWLDYFCQELIPMPCVVQSCPFSSEVWPQEAFGANLTSMLSACSIRSAVADPGVHGPRPLLRHEGGPAPRQEVVAPRVCRPGLAGPRAGLFNVWKRAGESTLLVIDASRANERLRAARAVFARRGPQRSKERAPSSPGRWSEFFALPAVPTWVLDMGGQDYLPRAHGEWR